MARAPDEIKTIAKEMYETGTALIEIANQFNIPEGTIRSWKNRGKWQRNENCNVAKKKSVSKKKVEVVATEVEQVIDNPDLTDKQRLFCLHYIKCFNATKAYQKAYECSYAVANVESCRLLGYPSIKKEIRQLKQARFNKEMIEPEDIFQKYMDIAFADITDYLSFGREEVPVMGAFGPVEVKDEETGIKSMLMKEINVVKFKESSSVDGTILAEVKQGKDGASIKLADRMKALDWLTAHMDMATEEQRARIEILKARTNTESNLIEINDGILNIAELLRSPMSNRRMPDDEGGD